MAVERKAIFGVDIVSEFDESTIEKELRGVCPGGTVLTGTVRRSKLVRGSCDAEDVCFGPKDEGKNVYLYSLVMVLPMKREAVLAMVGDPVKGYEATEEESRTVVAFDAFRQKFVMAMRARVGDCTDLCMKSLVAMLEGMTRTLKTKVFGDACFILRVFRMMARSLGLRTHDGGDIEGVEDEDIYGGHVEDCLGEEDGDDEDREEEGGEARRKEEGEMEKVEEWLRKLGF